MKKEDKRIKPVCMQWWKSKELEASSSHKGKGKGGAENKTDQESLKGTTWSLESQTLLTTHLPLYGIRGLTLTP